MRNLLRPIFVATVAVLLMAGATVSSDAARRSGARSGSSAYDGLWSVLIITQRGDCDRGYRYPVRIIGGRVTHGDADRSYQIYGAVGPGGTISVTVSGAGKTASGSGRLSSNYGQGRWRASSGECSGQWTAERRG